MKTLYSEFKVNTHIRIKLLPIVEINSLTGEIKIINTIIVTVYKHKTLVIISCESI